MVCKLENLSRILIMKLEGVGGLRRCSAAVLPTDGDAYF